MTTDPRALAQAIESSTGEEREQWKALARLLLGLLGRDVRPWAAQVRVLHEAGLTNEEIAQSTGYKPGTVANRVSALGLRANRKPREKAHAE